MFGDGTQTKPYIYIDDLIDGVMTMLSKANDNYNAYLVGVDSIVTVSQIAQIVMDEFGVKIPIRYAGKYSGWLGDVRKYSYDVTRLRMLGWTPQYTAQEAVRLAVKKNL